MKPNRLQKEICDVIKCEASFWQNTNDITSPTHLCNIGEEINLLSIFSISEELSSELKSLLENLYWLIREFDTKTE